MNVVGIVAEFNPFHNGHAYIIRKAREYAANPDCAVVCVMSGNFVQRGECAVMSKHTRAEAAVRCGADLIIELPLPYVLSSADIFAHGAVSLLCALGITTHLAFGSESGDISGLCNLADIMASSEANSVISSEMRRGIPYAAARQIAAESIAPKLSKLLKSPNDLLGCEYLSSLKRLGAKIEPIAIKRFGAEHDSQMPSDTFASATMLRELIAANEDVSNYIPSPALEVFKREFALGKAPVTMQSLETAIISRLRMLDESIFLSLPGAAGGLGARLMRSVNEPTLESIADNIKTKCYAHSRIRRLILCAALGIDFPCSYTTPPYVRVLAANEQGTKLLRTIKEQSSLPIITKPAHAKKLPEAARQLFELENAATNLYVLGRNAIAARSGSEEWLQGAIIIKNAN